MDNINASELIVEKHDRGILVVEDALDVQEAIVTLIKSKGYRKVFSASNAADAISILAKNGEEIYVVTLDMYMPNKDGEMFPQAGLQVVRHLANVHNYHVGIIIFTAYPSAELAKNFYDLQTDKVVAIDYVNKADASANQLIDEIEIALDSIYDKRKHNANLRSREIITRLSQIENQVSNISKLETKIDTIVKRQGGFLQQLGFELIKILIISLAVLALLSVGAADFIKKILGIP